MCMRKYLEAFTNNWVLLKFINKAITFNDCFRKIQSKHITWIYIHTLADKVNLVYLQEISRSLSVNCRNSHFSNWFRPFSLSDPKSSPREERKALFTVLVYQKKSLEIMTHAIDCFSYHTWWILDSSRKELEVAGCYNVWGTMTRVQWNPASLNQSELTRADIEGLQIVLRHIVNHSIS